MSRTVFLWVVLCCAAATAQVTADGRRIVHLVFAGRSTPVVENAEPLGPPIVLEGTSLPAGRCRPSGILFASPGLLASRKAATAVTRACVRSGELSLTAWVRPGALDQTGPARIVTISADTGQRNLTLGQQGDTYVMRLRTTARSVNGIPSLNGPRGVLTTSWTYVAYTRDRAGEARLYVNDKLVAQARVPGDFSNWDETFRMGIGNEMTADRSWLGEVRSVSMFDRALTPAEVDRDRRRAPPTAAEQAAPPPLVGVEAPLEFGDDAHWDGRDTEVTYGPPWEDDFAGTTLGPSWQWRVPAEGPTMSLTDRPGWLRVRLPERASGFNHWNEPKIVDEAPQLRLPAPAGDWELEARVQLQTFTAKDHFHVGLVAGLSDGFLLTFGALQAPTLSTGPKTPEACLEPSGLSSFCRTPVDARDLRLRLLRTGRILRARLSRDGKDWVAAGSYILAEAPRFVGFMGKTFGGGAEVVVDVDYVRLTPLVRPDATCRRALVGIGGEYPTGYRGMLSRHGLPHEVLLDYQLADVTVLRRFDMILIGSVRGSIAGRAREALMRYAWEGGTAVLSGRASPPASVVPGKGGKAKVKDLPDMLIAGSQNPLIPFLGKTTRFAPGESRHHFVPKSLAGLQVLARYDRQPKKKTKAMTRYLGAPTIWSKPLGRGLLVYSAPSLGATLSWGPTHDLLAEALLQCLGMGRMEPQLVKEGARFGRKQSGATDAEETADPSVTTAPVFERVTLSSPGGGLPPGSSSIRTKPAPEFNLSGTYRPSQGAARLLLNYWSARDLVSADFSRGSVRLTRTESGRAVDVAEMQIEDSVAVPFLIKERRDRVLLVIGTHRAEIRAGGLWKGRLAAVGAALGRVRYQPIEPAFLNDDFMRGKDEKGAWEVTAGTWSVRATGDPKMGANPFTYQGQAKGVGLVVTGLPFWDDYTFDVSVKPTSNRGTLAQAFHFRDSANHLLFRLRLSDAEDNTRNGVEIVQVVGTQESVLARGDGCLVKGQWHRLSVQIQEDAVTAVVDGRTVATAKDTVLHSGKIALWLRDAAAEFDDVEVRPVTKEPTVTSVELDGSVPRFAGTMDRDTWAGTALQWRADPLQPGLFRRRGVFHGDVDLAFTCDFGERTTGPLGMALLLTTPEGDRDTGYALSLRPTSQAAQRAAGVSQATYDVELAREGVAVDTCRVTAGVAPILVLRRVGERLLGAVDGKQVLECATVASPGGLSQLAFQATGFRPRVSGLHLRAGNVLDYCFDRAPTDWWVGSGTWELAVRWPCTPEWSWLAGGSKKTAALWHKRQFVGDMTLDLHVGPRTIDHGDGRAREICRAFNVVLCGDGRDVGSGYSFVVGADKNGTGATLSRNGKVVAREPAYRIFSDAHNQWINVRAEKQGAVVRLWVGDQRVLVWEDPAPLSGGRLAVWTKDNAIMIPRVTVYYAESPTGRAGRQR
ncbi:MAG: hypothetical protein HN742_08930 [Lentisphaerae bacterium]|nr:hypothetical protein [Lentisphaerota bacterium]MBT4815876.1 hypothetical protein [Lentisphaerota bacterium]MBT5611151.1 hypothetical protein [Lentisphaerota bacterium]MBT7054725.1 hypothetical protein [Lentisphaerota bacterium]MBT7841983.1 hypothetical protein [Lentisphaerota bacterium]